MSHRNAGTTGKESRTSLFKYIAVRITLWFSLAFVLVLGAVEIVGVTGIPGVPYPGRWEEHRIEALSSLDLIADLKRERLVRLLSEWRDDLRVLSSTASVTDNANELRTAYERLVAEGKNGQGLWTALSGESSFESLAKLMKEVRNAYGIYDRIDIIDAVRGRVIFSTDPTKLGQTVSWRPKYLNTRLFADSLSNVHVDALNHHPHIQFHHALSNGKDNVIAIIVADIDMDEVIKPILHTGEGLGKTGEALLVNEKGFILTGLKHKLPDGSIPLPLQHQITAKTAKRAAEGHEGVIDALDYRGEPVLAAYRHIRVTPEWGWGLVVKRDKAELFAPLKRDLKYSLMLGLGGAAVVIGLTIVLARGLTGPFRRLAETARQVTSGDLSVRSEEFSTYEAGYLASTFNTMLDRIQNWQEGLEAEVQTRTLNLREANTKLTEEIENRRHAEEALRTSEERFRLAIEDSPFPIMIHAEDGEVVQLNKVWTELTGFGLDEIPTIAEWTEKAYGDKKDFVIGEIDKLYNLDRRLDEGDFCIMTKNREARIWHFSSAPLGPLPDGRRMVISIAVDITERKQAEEERRQFEAGMQQTQKLESLGVMAGGIAHDFNNILFAILGNAELALDSMGVDAPEREHLEEIQTASRRAAGLTDQMLAYSGKGLLELGKIDLSELVREMANLLKVSHSKKVDLMCSFDDELPAVKADPSQLRQVVMNLITNASEAIGDEVGVVNIETGVTEASQEYLATSYVNDNLAGGNYVYLQVSDTGCGMDEDTQGKIFEPFFTTKFTGRGLGMAAVLGIIRAHNGAIHIDSEAGRGTTIKVLLPALEEPVEPPLEEKAVDKDWHASGTVLVVDDELQIRKLQEITLSIKGFTVLTAENGCEAVELFREHKDEIVCVLLDLTMPHMDGEETYAELRRIREDVPVILMSGYGEKQVKERLGQAGFSAFIKKPCQPRELMETIRRVLAGK